MTMQRLFRMDDRTSRPDPSEPDDQMNGDVGDAIEADAPDEHLSPDPQAQRVTVRPAGEALAGPPPGSPDNPRMAVSRERSWLWPLISLVGLAAVVLVNWLANWLPLNDRTTGAISNAHPVPFQPAGWVFSIWGVIYLLLAIFVIYTFFPSGRLNARIQAIGPLFLVANIANISWIFLWHWLKFQGSLIALVVLLGALASIYLMLRGVRRDAGSMSTLQRLIVAVPFSVYVAWACIATLANVQVWMREGGWDGGPFGLRGWTVIFLLTGIIVAAGIAFFAHDAAFPLVFVWAYLGIAQHQWDDDKLISILAIILVIAAAALTVMAFILSFDARSGPRMATGAATSRRTFWKRGPEETPPAAIS
jgi:translocator protein